MLKKSEIEIMRKNAKVHKEVFEKIKNMVQDGTTAKEVNKLC
jgi:methionine aminopeptidase